MRAEHNNFPIINHPIIVPPSPHHHGPTITTPSWSHHYHPIIVPPSSTPSLSHHHHLEGAQKWRGDDVVDGVARLPLQ